MHLPNPIIETTNYSVVWTGNIPVSEVVCNYNPDATIDYSPAEMADIEARWKVLTARRSKMKDLPLYRLRSIQGEGDKLILDLGRTGYKEYQCTNVRKPSWATENPENKMSNPLAISVVAKTPDPAIFINQRSASVGEYPNRLHVTPAGHIHPPQSIEEAIMAELDEELAITYRKIISEIRIIGLVINRDYNKPELIAELRVTPSAEEVLARSARDAWEYRTLQKLDWQENVIRDALTKDNLQWVPPGHAALLLAGRLDFGEGWMHSVLDAIC